MMPFSRCSLALLSCLVGVFSSSSRADFAGASYTEEVINPGEITFKIYLNYTNPLDWQLAVSGNANFSALQLTASSPLIQKHLVEAVPADVPGALALPGDSWVTIGEGIANGGETGFSPGFLAGQEDEFGALISGDGFLQADNGGYFDTNPSTQVQGTQILIAQFTFAAGTTWTFTGTSDFNAGGTDLTSAAFSVSNIGGFDDCDGDGLSDSGEILADPTLDCDNSGVLDSCEIADGTLQDCNGNGLPDVCSAQGDCNANGIEDYCESDCDFDGFIDPCDLDDDGDGILDDPCDAEICGVVIGVDCDGNGLLDTCDIADGAADCDGNGVLDTCDLADGAADCDSNGILDRCQPDCDGNGVADACDPDCDNDGIPDACEPDDDGDGIPDECDSFSCGAPGARVIRVAAGESHSIGLREDGTIACWGANEYGQCDAPDGVFTQVAAGEDHSIGLREDGTVAGWGRNTWGQCDAPDGVFTQVTTGEYHTLGLREDGTVACWGRNDWGQCDAPDGVFTQVAAGEDHSIGLREDGTIACWGSNNYGERDAPDGVFTQVGGGCYHSIGLREDGTIACWGWNSDGQCDAPDGVFTQVGGGCYHSIGLREDGTIACWGWNGYGQCDAPDLFTQVAVGYFHGIGLREDGTVACWGDNPDGRCDVPEELQIPSATQDDCDSNGVLDTCDLADGAADCDSNGILDRCEPDCDGNGVADACDPDCDDDGVPDACDDDDDGDGLDDTCDGEICGVIINDADMNGVRDDCEPCSPSLFLPIEVDEIQYNPGEISYRIHLRTPSVFDQVLAVSGDADISMLEFLADAELIQHELVSGTVLGDTPTAGFVLPGDSWVTIGPEGAEDTAFSPGFLGGDGATSVINGSSWSSSDNRGYFDAYPLTQVEGGRVLIAQFTLPEGAKFRYRGSVNFECGGEELARRPFRWSNDAEDCDANGEEDWVDLLDPANDCNSNGVVDICEFGGVNDCDSNGIPDECEPDCDGDGTTDACDSDDDGDGTPDECDADSCGVVDGAADCDSNGILDSCEPDCDGDGTIDACDLDDDADGIADECDADSCGLTLEDCDGNGVFDGCDPDCDVDGTPDACDLDDDGDGIPDECDADSCGVVGDDCDGNGVLDSCDPDCDTDGVPDACEDDCDTDGVPDDCESDCDSDGTPDDCDDDDDDDEIPDDCDADSCGFLGDDCDGDGVLDTCQLDPSTDCDNSGTLDVCDLVDDPGLDCDANGLLDFCQALEMPESDCDANLIPDTCDQDAGAADVNADGILDRCQCGDSGQTLPHPGPFAGESFGRSVDLDGNRAVVGVRDGEACYVFRFDGMDWVFEDFLISEDLDGDSAPDIAGLTNGWGQAVKIAGDSIAVGARLYNIPGTPPQFNAGIVVTFRFDNGAWVEDSRLAPPDQFEGDIFGESLDFEETVLVTSAPGADDSAEDAGEIHLFSRSLVDGWQWQQVYRPDGLAAGDRFGKAVAVEGELVVASATGDDDQGPQTGALYVSLRTTGSMILLDKLYSPEPWASQEYGTELDLQGGRIAAGAPVDNRNGPAQGLVGLHEQDDSGNWTATAIRPDNPQDYEYFGASVALDGDFLVVGAPGDDQNPQLDPPPGAIYVFERLGLGDWVQRRRITLPTYPFGELGLASAVDNGRILSGALFDDRYGEDAGLARVFDILPSLDCDADGLCDLSQIFEPDFDCNFNGVVDVCELDAVNDCDSNGVLDVCELDGRDCDDNGVLDSCDLAQGETDANCDGVLDVCQCLGDLNGSGVISFEDLVVLIAAWGELCPSSCPEDLDCNGVVDSMDLLTILSQWGPCGG